MASQILEFFRCPEWFADTDSRITVRGELASALDAVFSDDPFWGRGPEHSLSSAACGRLIKSLRYEQYHQAGSDAGLTSSSLVRRAYYFVRPLLMVQLRRHLQRIFLHGWQNRKFPCWPVDQTVDELLQQLLLAAMKVKGAERVPFIWFWPDGFSACAMMTHDVETEAGLRFCPQLMDVDDSHGVKSSFQIIPEERYAATPAELAHMRSRGFEVNVHDLNHDGLLFRDRENFRQRVERINAYGQKFNALGFRAGALYRNQEWYEWLKFEYDMSVPNVAHLDPQRGGCCTVFPYFIGDVLELPVTAIQDYSLFHVLGIYSIDLWRTQMDRIVENHGLVNVITHPDYLLEPRARQCYLSLLAYMCELRARQGVWIARPGEVNTWWRQRAKLKLAWKADAWSIVGEGHERAKVAYAEMHEGRVVYRFDEQRDIKPPHPAALRLSSLDPSVAVG